MRISRLLYAVAMLAFFTVPCVLPAYSAEAVKNPKMPVLAGKDAIETRFLTTADEILKKQGTLKLTEDQLKRIKDLINATVNDMIQRNAGIDAITVEINTLSWEDPFDMGAIERLSLEKHNLMVEKDKSIIQALKKLKEILTEDQQKALRNSR